jgi:ATP phosphoribosyltransferase regulatory subunit
MDRGRTEISTTADALAAHRLPSRAISRTVTNPADPPRALAHPLPAGMRDLLPEETRRRRALARRVLDHFALHGYQPVTPPAFEFAEVLERGLGTLDPSDVLRFVEPESGEVAALRPDMTPQIARMVATRLGREPWPIRLAYEGTIVRRRQGRARRHRQVPQAGVELYGAPGQAGDLEILRLAASVLGGLGLTEVVIDLGHASIARGLLEGLPPALSAEVSDALEQKDGARVDRLLAAQGQRGPVAAAIARLPDLQGGGPGEIAGEAVLDRAAPIFAGTPAEAPLRELGALWAAAARAPGDLGRVLRLDLGEVRGFAYYTGAIFHLLAPGPGEPIGAGGRYDDLLARFDAPMPAVGFALYLDAVAWAREAAGIHDRPPRSAVVACGSDDEAAPIVAALRARGIAAVAHAAAGAAAYAAAWRFSHLVTASGDPRRYRAESGGEPVIKGVWGGGSWGSGPEGTAAGDPQRSPPIVIEEGDPEALARAIAEQ